MPAKPPNPNTPHDPSKRLSTHPLYIAHQAAQAQIASDAELARRLSDSVDPREAQIQKDQALAARMGYKNGQSARANAGVGAGGVRAGGGASGGGSVAVPLYYQRHHEDQWAARQGQQRGQQQQPSTPATRRSPPPPAATQRTSTIHPHPSSRNPSSSQAHARAQQQPSTSSSVASHSRDYSYSASASASHDPDNSTITTPVPARKTLTPAEIYGSVARPHPPSPRPSGAQLRSTSTAKAAAASPSEAPAGPTREYIPPTAPKMEMEEVSGATPCGCPVSEEQMAVNRRNVVAAYEMRGRGGVADGGLQKLFTGFWPKVPGRPWAFDGVRDP